MQGVQFSLVTTFEEAEEFARWLAQPRTWLGVDTETGGFDWWKNRLRLVQIGDRDRGWAIPWEDWRGFIRQMLEGYDRPMTFHNAKFDLHFLERNGISIARHLVHDTMLMSHVLNPPGPHGLKPLSAQHIHPAAQQGERELKQAMMKGKWTWDSVPIDLPEYWVYGAMDGVLAARLAEIFYPQVAQSFRSIYELEIGVMLTLLDMETRGMRIDHDYCTQQSRALADWEEQMVEWFAGLGIENPNSDRQIVHYLQQQGVVLWKRTPKGNLKLDSEVLNEMTHPVARALIQYREAVKTRSTYYDAFLEHADETPEGWVLHTSINQIGAVTGRMSSSRPNLQNVPRSERVRNAFIPREGRKLLLADFDQIELRLMAHYAGVQGMLDAVLAGEDLHTFVGKMIYRTDTITKAQRQIVKAANFAKIYGAGPAKFGMTAGISEDEAQSFMVAYDATFPEVRTFMQQLMNQVRQSGSIITPYAGRQQVASPDKAYKIVNYAIQGTAADVMKRKLVEMANTPAGEFMLMPIHDEIAFDVPEEDVEEVRRIIDKVMPESSFSIPLSVGSDIVSRWGEKYA